VTPWVGLSIQIVTLVHCKIPILFNEQDIQKREGGIERPNDKELDVTDGINPKCTTCVNDRQKLLHGLLKDHHIVQ